MISAAYVGDHTMRIDEVAVVPPGPGHVQVRVAYVGICGTDLHIVHGAMDARVTMPAVIGHEMSGVVEALGDGVPDWAPGDRVTTSAEVISSAGTSAGASGAGDAFVAGYITELLAGAAPEQRLRTAVLCGVFACLTDGDWEGNPTRAELALLDSKEPVVR